MPVSSLKALRIFIPAKFARSIWRNCLRKTLQSSRFGEYSLEWIRRRSLWFGCATYTMPWTERCSSRSIHATMNYWRRDGIGAARNAGILKEVRKRCHQRNRWSLCLFQVLLLIVVKIWRNLVLVVLFVENGTVKCTCGYPHKRYTTHKKHVFVCLYPSIDWRYSRILQYSIPRFYPR